MSLLDGSDAEISDAAIYAFGRLTNERSAGRLISAMRRRGTVSARYLYAVVYALDQIKDQATIGILRALADKTDSRIPARVSFFADYVLRTKFAIGKS